VAPHPERNRGAALLTLGQAVAAEVRLIVCGGRAAAPPLHGSPGGCLLNPNSRSGDRRFNPDHAKCPSCGGKSAGCRRERQEGHECGNHF
jgi:hypothetical protein